MSTISVDYDVLNQKGSPAWFSDTFANIPTFGYKGRMFISIDTFAFYRDTGTGWDLIGGPGIGTLTGSGATGQVSFFNGTQVLTGNNNLFWDNTNSRLGINTATPGAPLDIHGTGTQLQLNGTGVNNSYLIFQNAGTSKWRIGNLYNAGVNTFEIYNAATSSLAFSIASATNEVVTQGKLTANGIITTLSTLSNGTYFYTLPSATGTLALTSNLSAYLPLAGGTLTGALIGTSATFTGDLTIDTNTLFVDSANNRIGIGTTSPSTTLHVLGPIRSQDSRGGSFAAVEISGGSSSFDPYISVDQSNPLTFRLTGTEKMRIVNGGNVLINRTTVSGSGKLQIATSGGDGIGILQNSGGGYGISIVTASNGGTYYFQAYVAGATDVGSITSNGTTTAYNVTSDYRLKENILPITNAIEKVLNIKPVIYKWKNTDNLYGEGFIAHELQEIIPLAVTGEKDAIDENGKIILQQVDYSKLVPTLVKAIQELNEKLVRNNIN